MKRYDDWFMKDDFSPLELALLMADTAPTWPLARDILKVVEHDDGEAFEKFTATYGHLPSQWSFFEKFQRCQALIYKHLKAGRLKGKALPNGGISRSAAIEFVAWADESELAGGESYAVFLRAAMYGDRQSAAVAARRGDKPWWQQMHDLDDMIKAKAAIFREKGIHLYRGEPSRARLALEIAATINSIEVGRKTGNSIEPETVRRYLKNRKI
ncbi:hypothetical protein [Duganella radicis]|uniref:Uncharacterized protein n=1 Tax=Duganella radicis TaxID=551988 RepID=A0A6L6PH19_9BURK|nr:hypothetical protein [Duganella radicis]MTV38039.1 hypothetical protein [Duganella radicis]